MPSDLATHDLLLEQARRFASRLDSARIDREGCIGADVLERAAEIGLFGLTIDERYGGLDLGLAGACDVVAAIAEHDRSVATSIGLHAGLGTRPLATLGSAALRDRYLPRLAAGEIVASFAATEAGAGSDLMAVRTTVADDGVGGLRLDGEKHYVTNGGFAGLYTVLARSPGLGGNASHSLVCVPREAAGILVGPEEEKLGLKGSSTVSVAFDGVRVGRDHVLEPAGRGMTQAHGVLAWGRTLMSAGSVGLARAALDAAREHVRTRKQFGRRLAEFGAVQSQLCAMAARLWAMEALVEEVGRVEARSGDIASLSTAAKVFCSEGAQLLADRAIQLHGALGFLEGTGVPRLLRDCRISRIFEGANDVLLLLSAVELASGVELDLRLDGVPSGLAEEVSELERAADLFRLTLRDARARHGIRLIREQRLLQHLARAHIDLVAASLAVARNGSETELGELLARRAAESLVREARSELAGTARSEERARADARLAEGLLESTTLRPHLRRTGTSRWAS